MMMVMMTTVKLMMMTVTTDILMVTMMMMIQNSFKHFLYNVFFSGVKGFQQAGMKLLVVDQSKFLLKNVKNQPSC